MTDDRVYRIRAQEAKFAGADWLRTNGCQLSPLGADVADLLGQMYQGIYHLRDVISCTDWSGKDYVEVLLSDNLATYDGGRLTFLVLLCHQAAIRCEINPHSRQRLKLIFHRRSCRIGPLWRRHPTINQAIEEFGEWNGWEPEVGGNAVEGTDGQERD